MPRLTMRRTLLVSLSTAGALALTGCLAGQPAAPSATATPASTSTSATQATSAAPATSAAATRSTPAASSTTAAPSRTPASSSAVPTNSASSTPASSSAVPTTSAPTTSTAATSASGTSAAASSSAASPATACSGLTGEEAWAQVLAAGGTDSPDPATAQDTIDQLLANSVETSGYDDCAALSWIAAPLSGHALGPVELHLFHAGEHVGRATTEDYAAPSVERVDDETVQVTYHYARDNESNAMASGKAVSTFTWDETTESVVHEGEFPPGYGEASAGTAPPSAATAADEPRTLNHSDDKGFCFASPAQATCYGKVNNAATLPASGAPTSTTDLLATGFEEVPNPVTLAPGESSTIGPMACTATAGGFDCVNEETGAGISVAGPTMKLTQPTG